MPDTVRTHPRVFTTLTAPSFGPVHNRPTNTDGAISGAIGRETQGMTNRAHRWAWVSGGALRPVAGEAQS
uniref:hypothetical protein n=1 Tax=Streptomyces sp. NBC_00998 TaxID=2903712 RepID=UPI003BAC3435